MAAPFGNHPRLIDYLGWCSSQGCTATSGFTSKEGKTITFHIIKTADGERHVVVSGVNNNEFLLPTTVAYYDRRLGLDSPFAKIGDGYDEPSQGE